MASAELKMDLDLDCQLNWVDRSTIPQEIMDSLRERNEIWLETTQMDESNLLSTKLSRWFAIAILSHWEGEDEAAAEHLDIAKEILALESERRDVPLSHRQAFRYLIRANKAVLDFRRLGNCAEVEYARERAREVDIEDPKTKAMILAMKAGVVGFYGDREGRVELFRQVVVLDPEYGEYWTELFMALRRLRREAYHLAEPSEEEVKIMEKAYDLDQDSPSILLGMTSLYHDIVKAISTNGSNFEYMGLGMGLDLENVVIQLKSFARKAFYSSPESVQAGIRLAEILCIGRNGDKWTTDEASLSEAEAQFVLCLEKWPRSSHVLHKAGKFYFNVRQDTEKGIGLLKDSLKDESTNFSSLMDYLRYTSKVELRNRRGLDTLIELIDEYLPFHTQRKPLSSKLLCLKAALLAKKHEFKEALQLWTKAIFIYPSICSSDDQGLPGGKAYQVGQIFGGGTFRNLLQYTEFNSLRTHVKKEIDLEPLDSDCLETLKKLLEAIEQELSHSGDGHGSGEPKIRRQVLLSESDQDTDWRGSQRAQYENPETRPNSSSCYTGFMGPGSGLYAQFPLAELAHNTNNDSRRTRQRQYHGDYSSNTPAYYSANNSDYYPGPMTRQQNAPYHRPYQSQAADVDDNWRRQ